MYNNEIIQAITIEIAHIVNSLCSKTRSIIRYSVEWLAPEVQEILSEHIIKRATNPYIIESVVVQIASWRYESTKAIKCIADNKAGNQLGGIDNCRLRYTRK